MNTEKQIKKIVYKRLVFQIPETKHKEIKLAATELGLTMTSFIDMAIKEKIEKELS